uniref:Cytochrome P450 n=1 Tax=Leersia perrieri TaxID=77586 RepID=A0A0D9WPY1_9ORYZ
METNTLYCVLALLPLVYYFIRSLFPSSHQSDHHLRLPPGPWRLPLIGSLHHLIGSLPHRALRDLSRRHGPLMLLRFGHSPPVIVASTAAAAREIMRTHDDAFSSRPLSAVVRVSTKHGAGITFAPYGEHWRQVRKICRVELLGPKRILAFRSVREEEAARLVRAVASSSVVDLSELLGNYVTDTTVHIVMGERFRERDALLRFVDEAVRLAGSLTLADLFPASRLARVLSRRTLRRAEVFIDSLMEFMDRVIKEHLEKRSCLKGGEREEDIVDVLLRLRAEGSLHFDLTMGIFKAVIFDLFAGGSETAATTLQWAMAELMKNPSVMSRA